MAINRTKSVYNRTQSVFNILFLCKTDLFMLILDFSLCIISSQKGAGELAGFTFLWYNKKNGEDYPYEKV